MTYMSIPRGLQAAVKSGRLICLPSCLTEYETARQIYACAAIVEAVSGPFCEDGSEDDLIEFRAHLDGFLEGADLTVSEEPHDHPPETMLARVHPVSVEIWDQRSTAPHPGIRCLGGFWERDVFVALHWDYRENIDWDRDIAKTLTVWQDIFGTQQPQSWSSLDAYLTIYHVI